MSVFPSIEDNYQIKQPTMKYVGDTSPAWTIGKRLASHDKVDQRNPEQYDWHVGSDFLAQKVGNVKLHPYSKKGLFDEQAKKHEKPRGRSQNKSNSKKVNFSKDEKKLKESTEIKSQLSTKLGFFTRTNNRFKPPRTETSGDVGPMTYDIIQKVPREISMAYKTEADSAIVPADIIGPGVYDPSFTVIDKYKGSIRFASLSDKHLMRVRPKSQSPGPGYYDAASLPPDNKFHSKKGTFSHFERKDMVKISGSGALGPGSYMNIINSIEGNLKAKHKKGILKSGPAKDLSIKSNGIPGPGLYDLSSGKVRYIGGAMAKIGRTKTSEAEKVKEKAVEKATKITFDSSQQRARSQSVPRKVQKLAPVFTTFGKAERRWLSKDKIALPGPADYQITLPQRSVSVSLGKALKFHTKEEIPDLGPGHYDITKNDDFQANKTHWKGVKYSKPHLRMGQPPGPTPGPQHYKVQYSQVDPSETPLGVIIPRQKKQFSWQSGDPEIDTAPGLYDIKSTVPQLPPFETPEAKERGIRGLFS